MTSMNLRSALFYASKGWPVLPVWPIRHGKCLCGTDCGKNAGKHPISWYRGKLIAQKGLDNATTDPDQIRLWWTEVPDANIGCVGTEWFAVDVDDREVYDMLIEGYGELPHTPTQFSGGGGMHMLFKQPVPRIGSRRGKIPKGIDIRGKNGYVLLAPSSHVDGEYAWELSSKPSQIEIAEAPKWLLDLIGPPEGVVTFSDTNSAPDLGEIKVSQVTRERIMTPTPRPGRSQMDQKVVNALVSAGLADDEIRAIYQSYPIGTAGKYAEKGPHADRYLALTIASARAYVKDQAVSRAIPGMVITKEEAEIEKRVIAEIYWKGWNAALVENPELATKLFPDYLGLNDNLMAETIIKHFGIGFRSDYHFSQVDGADFAALVVPLSNTMGDTSNIDYTILNPPDGVQSRQWEEPTAPVFITDGSKIGSKRLVVLDDWDTVAYVYLKMGHLLPDDIGLISLSKAMPARSMNAFELEPLLEIASESEQIIFVRHLSDVDDVKWLADWIGWDRTRWVGWPFEPRKMFRDTVMSAELFTRALRGALPVV